MNTTSNTNWVIFLAILILNESCQNRNKLGGKADCPITMKDTLAHLQTENTRTVASYSPGIEILLPSSYRKENGYPTDPKGKQWYELYKDNQSEKWLITKADLKVTYGRDECVNDEVMIIQSEHKNAILFFTPFKGLNTEITTLLEDKALFPERKLAFTFNGEEYKLSPMGTVYDDEGNILLAEVIKEKSEEALRDSRITSYILSFIQPDGTTYPMAAIDEIQSAIPKVVWAGDLNGDGLPDLILDLRDFYESQHIFLFLSDKSDKEKTLKKVADLKVVTDC